MFHVDILSLFPGYFVSPLNTSILARAQKAGLIQVDLHDIRAYSQEPRHKVDERPFGGGPGMVMMADPVARAIASVRTSKSHVVYLSPRGIPFSSKVARRLSQYEHLVLLSGHYEGIDQRVLDSDVDEEISIGDYVLTNGCLASLVVLDATIRFIPDVLGHEEASLQDSFEDGLLDCAHYTKPLEYKGKIVPEVLRSGDHKKIADWRYGERLDRTKRVRPDIYARYLADSFVGAVKDEESVAKYQGNVDYIVVHVQDALEVSRFWKNIVSSSSVRVQGNQVTINLGRFSLIYEESGEKHGFEVGVSVIGLQVSSAVFMRLVYLIKKIGNGSIQDDLCAFKDPQGNSFVARRENQVDGMTK